MLQRIEIITNKLKLKPECAEVLNKAVKTVNKNTIQEYNVVC